MELLQRSLARGRLAHAYLFTGEDMPVLEGMARTLAKVLNCEHPIRDAAGTGDCCDRCSSCRRIDEEKHPDLTWVRPASKLRLIRVAQVRDLLHTVYLRPTEGKWKVAALVGAERMNDQAANALLKTLEEPPGNAVLILLSSRPEQLLETVVSRCLRLRFAGEGRPAASEGAKDAWLSEFGEALQGGGATVLARYRLLGRLLSRLEELREQITAQLQERSPLESNPEVDSELQGRWETELAAAAESEYRRRRAELLGGLEWLFRDVWALTQGVGDDLLMLPAMRKTASRLASRIQPQDALENLRALARVLRLLETNAQEALVLEVGLLKLRL